MGTTPARYWTIKEVASYLNMKPSTLYAWVAQRKIPALKIHGLVRFDPEALARWVQTFQIPPRPRPPRAASRRQPTFDLDHLIARSQRAAYTARHGETRPRSSLTRKEDTDGAL